MRLNLTMMTGTHVIGLLDKCITEKNLRSRSWYRYQKRAHIVIYFRINSSSFALGDLFLPCLVRHVYLTPGLDGYICGPLNLRGALHAISTLFGPFVVAW